MGLGAGGRDRTSCRQRQVSTANIRIMESLPPRAAVSPEAEKRVARNQSHYFATCSRQTGMLSVRFRDDAVVYRTRRQVGARRASRERLAHFATECPSVPPHRWSIEPDIAVVQPYSALSLKVLRCARRRVFRKADDRLFQLRINFIGYGHYVQKQ
jgi:hypothetical protein